MEEVAFQDWPGQPVDVNSGNNPWMPAYGFQTPTSLLEKEDFIGNPDAEYFLQNSTGNYMYLETIQEETSDDLRSDSDLDSRNSPVGWLATDSESGSVICMDQSDDFDCDSDRELACPPKRRRQEIFLVVPNHEDEDESSLSRSSSLLQFETLEKECQQESSSPSIFSQFSFDSLEIANHSFKKGFSAEDFSPDYDVEFFKSIGNDVDRSKQNGSRDSLLYNASTRFSGSDSSDSDTTLEGSRSCDNLKTWRSFDSLPLGNGANGGGKKFSSENLSEDSGYGDQLLTNRGNLSNSAGNLVENYRRNGGMARSFEDKKGKKKNSYVGFSAYDCDVNQHFNGNFGISYQDLSIFDRYDPLAEPISKSPLTDHFLRKKQRQQLLNQSTNYPHAINLNVNLEQECHYANFSNVSHAASVPNLLNASVEISDQVVSVASVPKNLNFISDFSCTSSSSVAEKNWNLADLGFVLAGKVFDNGDKTNTKDVDEQRFIDKDKSDSASGQTSDKSDDICSLAEQLSLQAGEITPNNDCLIVHSDKEAIMASYKREGSYDKAMTNRVDLSDDESSLVYKKKLPKSPIVEFDKRVLKAISEQSLQSILSSTTSLHGSQKYLQSPDFASSTPVKRQMSSVGGVAMSTPDLNRLEPATKRERVYYDDDRRKSTQEISRRFEKESIEEERSKNILLDEDHFEDEVVIRRKGSVIKSSTSTSGMSDIDEKTLRHSVKSFSGSTGSKGVHFSPVVAEVNWRDDGSASTTTPERESSYSLNSSSPEPIRSSPNHKLVKPKPRYPKTHRQRSVSQPDLSDNESKDFKKEFVDGLKSLRDYNVNISKSQPEVSKFKRRGSQLIKTDKDGCTIKAYVDIDGVQYKHTHLDMKTVSSTSLNDSTSKINSTTEKTGSKNNLTSKFPFHQPISNTGQSVITGTCEDNIRQSSGKQLNVKQSNVAGMAENAATGDPRARKSKSKSGLGGFLQRLASFRLGAKKGQEQKEKLKSRQQGVRVVQGNGAAATVPSAAPRPATKADYIYIPLKGPAVVPLDNNNSNAAPVCAKPPLPKQPPPRVVHASVKKPATAHASSGGGLDDRRRRRTIDSASVGIGNHATSARRNVGHGDASMDGPMGLIETDLDTEVTVITSGANAKARSLLNLGPEPRLQVPSNAEGDNRPGRPHKSMEFLLDKQNLKVVEPPENELQKTERVMSEHELRVQRSLQKLTVPDWYKHAQVPAQGFLLKKHPSRETRWTGTSPKTTSLSSLGLGTQSPLVLSPTPCNQPFVRWSTSKLNSTASSPCQSTRSSFNTGRQPNGSISPSSSARSSFSYRQPYMGWRSQERLNRPRTPAERLASSLLAHQSQNQGVQQESPEIQTSIKEVTSAIVHYVSGLKPGTEDKVLDLDNTSQRSSSVSPRGSQKLCWLESSFVGTKPLDSPETPVTCSESPVPPQGLRLDLQNHSSTGESIRA